MSLPSYRRFQRSVATRKSRGPGSRKTIGRAFEMLEERAVLAHIHVTTTADVVDPSDGLTSLREALTQAASTVGTTDNIWVRPNQTYTLTLGELTLTDVDGVKVEADNLTYGPGNATIDAAGASRIFNGLAGSHTQIVLIDLINGASTSSGGAITNAGWLGLYGLTLRNSGTTGANAHGGAVYNTGTLVLSRATIRNNSTTGASAYGGAIYNAGTLEGNIFSSLIELNSTSGNDAHGGGIYNAGTVQDGMFDIKTNRTTGANAEGGGVYNATTGIYEFEASFEGNYTQGTAARGGGIANHGVMNIQTGGLFIGVDIRSNYTLGLDASGGGIYNTGTMDLSLVNLQGNFTQGNNAPGGGLHNTATGDVLLPLVITENYTKGNDSHGGGVYSLGSITYDLGAQITEDIEVSRNQTEGAQAHGGGIYHGSGTLELILSDVMYNSTLGQGSHGGGIYNDATLKLSAGAVVKRNVTQGDNSNGGGIYNASAGTLLLTSAPIQNFPSAQPEVTYNEVRAFTCAGGGIYNRGILTADGAVIANNKAANTLGGGLYIAAGTGAVSFAAASGNLNRVTANTGDGITIAGSNASITKTQVFSNTGRGIAVFGSSAVGNTIRMNSIFNNGRLELDLARDGLTLNDPNDPDVGSNMRQNFPILTQFDSALSATTVTGILNSRPNATYTIDVYSNFNTLVDPSGYGGGVNHLGSFTVTTDASGNASFHQVLPAGTVGSVTATATDAQGNTSEFSKALAQSALPVAAERVYSTTRDKTLSVAAPGVLGTATDLQGETLQATLVAPPASGQLTLNSNGSFTFVPQLYFTGSVNFTYTLTDGTATSNVATVTIQVNNLPTPPAVTPAARKDDGDWGYRDRGPWQKITGGWQGDMRTIAAGTGTNSASWTLTAAPGYYELYATWLENATRASNATYTIYDLATSKGTVTRNQKHKPNDASFNGKGWRSLGVYQFNSRSITVQLNDNADGVVVADGIIAVPTTPPPPLRIAGGVRVTGSESGPSLTLDALQPIAAEAVARWNRAGLTPSQEATLRNTAFDIADLPNGILGLASATRIWIDRDAAGAGWYLDPIPGDDTEFSKSGGKATRGHRASNGPAHRIDLLSVIAHELGHVLGLGHDDSDGVMAESLAAGVRRAPTEHHSAASEPGNAHHQRAWVVDAVMASRATRAAAQASSSNMLPRAAKPAGGNASDIASVARASVASKRGSLFDHQAAGDRTNNQRHLRPTVSATDEAFRSLEDQA